MPGQDWKRSVEHHLVQAHIILPLVSIKFLSSEFCYSIQIQPALDRHNANEACVIPVILRPCDWKPEAFGHLQPLPQRGRPVAKWKPRDDAYVNIVVGIHKAINHLLHLNEGSVRTQDTQPIEVPLPFLAIASSTVRLGNGFLSFFGSSPACQGESHSDALYPVAC